MADHKYSLKNFFRQAPKSLVDRYFHERGMLMDLNISALAETDVEPIYEAWLELPASDRPKTEQDFRLIDSVADEQGIMAILEEANFHGVRLQERFAEMAGFHDRSLWTFLEHSDWLENAARFREADELPKTYWREYDGLVGISPRDDKAGCEDLANVLKDYFRKKEGRGNACWVEVFRRGSRYYYFAYTEDHSKVIFEFEGQEDNLQKRAHRPVFEIVFVYDPENGKFSTYYRGQAATIRDLQQIFARDILLTNLGQPDRDQRVYDLNPLKHRSFQFRYDPSSGIVNLRVKLLKLAIIGGGTQRITLDVNPSRNAEALYDLLDEVLNTGDQNSNGKAIPLSLVNVTKVGIRACFMPEGRWKKPTKTFYLSFPNRCTLELEGKDLALRQMLIDSGIEPKPPSALMGL